MKDMDYCIRCGSEFLVKKGKQFNEYGGTWRQEYQCKDCNKKMVGRQKHIAAPIQEDFVYKSKPVPSQDWSAYTKAQNQHKQGLMDILAEMLDIIEIKCTKTVGKPNAKLKEICFALALKTFTRISSRRLHSELEQARQLGYINHVPHFTILMKYLGSNEMNQLLKELLKLSSLPIKQMNSKSFSVDATGFSTNQFGRWFDHMYGKEVTKREWLKCHAMAENTSNVIVNATITIGTGADSPQLERLVTETSKNFEINAICADKAYSSRKNLEIVSKLGAKPFIPFKKNARIGKRGSMIWRKTFEYFKNKPQEFNENYHRRSNIETSFAMLKQKFGTYLSSKNFNSQENEILLKLICHNLSCLVHEYYERKIDKYIPTKVPKITILQK